MVSAAPMIKAALVVQLQSLYPPPILVSYGDPGVYEPDVIVAVMDMRPSIEVATAGTNRSQEETIEIDVVFSVWRAATDNVQPATEQAFALLGQLQAWLKARPNETINGTCRNALVTSYPLVESNSTDAQSGDVTGQVATITAVLTCKARI